MATLCVSARGRFDRSSIEKKNKALNHQVSISLSKWDKIIRTIEYHQKIQIVIVNLCLVLLQVPKCFGQVQIFCARPKSYLNIVTVTNILCQTKRWFAFSKIVFCVGTKVFEEALNAVKFRGWLKKFGMAQNILGPVKGQGITV